MSDGVTQVTDLFPLAHFERALDSFRPPTEDFHPQGSWVNAYDIWECSQGSWKVGAMMITRTPLDAGAARLDVQFRKGAAGGSQRAQMTVECRTDALATPIRWQVQSVAHDTDDRPIEETRLRERGEVTEGGLRVRVGDKPVRTPIQGPLALTWCLFDAVQRLPGAAMKPLEFTLIDRLAHQIKPGQRLAFSRAPTVELGGKRVWHEEKHQLERGAVYRPVPAREGAVATALRSYDHTGRGIVPTVYWVDERGRLLFVLSGLFGYILNPEAQP